MEILDSPLLQQIISISVKRMTRAFNGSIVLDQKTKITLECWDSVVWFTEDSSISPEVLQIHASSICMCT